ncbi:MAG TPA: MFS transporter [Roseiarcus sp.]|nr:MFS transporter [Roseiarcus sp.]
MGYSVVTTTLVTVGRISDVFGRVRVYTIGFAVFTLASVLLTLTWSSGVAGAFEIIGLRVIQGIGAASLFANSAAIIADFFPAHRRGFALGTNTDRAARSVLRRRCNVPNFRFRLALAW